MKKFGFSLLFSFFCIFNTANALVCPTFIAQNESIYNVKLEPYLAAGNGTTDDTGAIQCAINHVASNGGGVVYFPSGNYVHSGLTITGTSITLQGVVESATSHNSANGSKLIYNQNSGDQIYIGGTASAKTIHIKNLSMTTNQDQTSGHFIHAYGILEKNTEGEITTDISATKLVFEDLQLFGRFHQNLNNSSYNGILLNGVNSVVMNKIKIFGLTGEYAIKLAGTNRQSDLFRFSNVTFNHESNSKPDYRVATANGLVIEDNVNSVKTFAFDLLRAKNGIVVGSSSDLPDSHYIYLLDVSIEDTLEHGIVSNNHGEYLEIKNCYIHVTGLHGIYIKENTGPTHISGCTVQRNGKKHNESNPAANKGTGILLLGQRGGSVVGNYIADNFYAGINVFPSADGYSISSNNIIDSGLDGSIPRQDYGIILHTNSQNNAVIGNILKNNGTNIYHGSYINSVITNNVEY